MTKLVDSAEAVAIYQEFAEPYMRYDYTPGEDRTPGEAAKFPKNINQFTFHGADGLANFINFLNAKRTQGPGWIAVDLDATLAKYEKWGGPTEIGEPIQPMVERVLNWLAEGKDVRIFTARVAVSEPHRTAVVKAIHDWCERVFGVVLPVTNLKDTAMLTLYDDRCVQVEKNTGRLVGEL